MYDKYEFTLSEQYLKIAEEELREDEARRKQALQQIREWIEKHPNIKKCKTDSKFLLRFLRVKKFAVQSACELLENYLDTRQKFAKWFQNMNVQNPRIMDLIEKGFMVLMKDRDEYSRKITVVNFGCLDADVNTFDDIIRVNNLVAAHFIDKEENQIAGYVLIADFTNLSFKTLSLLSLIDFKIWLTYISKAVAMRIKKVHIVNLPSFASTFCEFGLNFLGKKMKDRVHFHRNFESLHKLIDPKLLPQEYGGNIPKSKLVNDLKNTLLEHRAEILQYSQSFLMINKCNNWNDNVGSFRKLNID